MARRSFPDAGEASSESRAARSRRFYASLEGVTPAGARISP